MLYILEALFILAPSYVIRFKLSDLPLNLLEILVLAFWLAFLIWISRQKSFQEFKNFCFKGHSRPFLIAVALFLLAGFISALISPAHMRAAGLFAVYFLMPVLTYFPAAYILQRPAQKPHFLRVIFLLLGIYGLYAIIQYFTLIGVPQQWWGNSVEPKRALAVFEYPNAFALWLTPLLAFCLPALFDKEFKPAWFKATCFVLGLGGLIFTLSRGGWAGFLAAAILFGLLSANKKILAYLAIIILISAAIIYHYPNLRYRLILPFKGDKSTLSRFSLWHTAWAMIKSSPILGKGLYGFRTLYDKFNTDSLTAAYDYPHNVFLNFWVETGLLGLFSFLYISGQKIVQGLKNKENIYKLGLALFIIALFVHGLIDVPYFLNVLALTFWMMLALAY